jgi:hypothetical protein
MKKIKVTLASLGGVAYARMLQNIIKGILDTNGYFFKHIKIERKAVNFDTEDGEKYYEFEVVFQRQLSIEQRSALRTALGKFSSSHSGIYFSWLGQTLQVIYCAPGFVIPEGHPNHIKKYTLLPPDKVNKVEIKRKVVGVKVEKLKMAVSLTEPVFHTIGVLTSNLVGPALEKLETKVEGALEVMSDFYQYVISEQKEGNFATASYSANADLKPVRRFLKELANTVVINENNEIMQNRKPFMEKRVPKVVNVNRHKKLSIMIDDGETGHQPTKI